MNEKQTFDSIVEFNQLSGQEVNWPAKWPSAQTLDLKMKLIREELKELEEELVLQRSLYDTGKEIADLLYVVHGLATSLGINSQACLVEVAESNMSKYSLDRSLIVESVQQLNTENGKNYCEVASSGHYFFVRRKADGKVLKPVCYFSPEMKNAVYTEDDMVDLNREIAIENGLLSESYRRS